MRRRLVLLAALSWFGCEGSTGSREPWNLVLVSVDTLRADHVSAYDLEGSAQTPNLDRLAIEGILFETVQTVAPTTLPSHASLFTGLAPPRHGVRDNVGFYLSSEVPTLAQRLKEAGYRTGAFVGAFVLDSRFGLDQGFDTYFDDFESDEAATRVGVISQRKGGEVLERALAWLQANTGGNGQPPFFAFLHFYDPHAPYEVAGATESSPEVRYRGEVAYVDTLVGELLDWLDRSQQASRTVVVLTSDHGESLGEHGEDTHGFFVYQSTLAVPWLMRVPGGPRGVRLTGLSRLVDVTPTLLDLLRLPPLDGVDGISLVPFLDSGTVPPVPAYSETFFPRVHFGWSELRSLRQGDIKLILAPRPELYDLARDPGETTNLAGQDPERVRSMAAELERGLKGEVVTERGPDRESLERLRSLGYVGGNPSAGAHRDDPKDRLDSYKVLIDTELSDVSPADGARFTEALRRLEKAMETDPKVLRTYVLYGDLLLKGGETEQAAEVFERLLVVDDRSFEGHYGLGVALARSGRLDAAFAELELARALEPEDTKSYFQLAEIETLRGNWSSAERWLREAIDRNPDRTLTERLAHVLIESGRPEEARPLLSELAENAASDPLASYNLGQMLLLVGEAEQALAHFRRASELSPDADAVQGIGNALVALKMYPEAVAAFERAVALTPCFTPALSNLGSAYVEMKRLDLARAPLEKAIACDPGYARAYQNLAAVHVEAGELERAISVLRAGVKSNPENLELARTLTELERYRRSLR
ncbi:MAG TPA: sulfatase-like hydrolase/transferase [Vicinamibacteria bacterium]|nr:sulfatase-like hydrolase/transferase [Vicinamibacteria bacterium]